MVVIIKREGREAIALRTIVDEKREEEEGHFLFFFISLFVCTAPVAFSGLPRSIGSISTKICN